MAREVDQEDTAAPQPGKRRRTRRAARVAGIVLGVLVLAITLLWSQRIGITDDYIADMLEQMDLDATYEIESIAPETQVFRNIVVGDPARPDATIERAVVRLSLRFGLPRIEAVEVHGARLWGRIVDGKSSFGALDPLIFTDSEEPFALPDLRLVLSDAKAMIEGDHGPIALSLKGEGHLQDGFAGELAAVAPQLLLAGCEARDTTLFGALSVADGRPRLAGPIRFGRMVCPEQGLAVAGGGIELDLAADADMAGVDGEGGLVTGAVSHPDLQLAALAGTARVRWREGDLTSSFDLEGRQLASGAVRLALLEANGTLRSRDSFSRIELEADLAGSSFQPGDGWGATLAGIEQAGAGTLVQPLVGQFRHQLASQLEGSTLAASLTLRRTGERLGLVVPEARLRGRDGQSLLLVSRSSLGFSDNGLPLFAGNFMTGGTGLPQISGRMEQGQGGALELRARMAQYRAGEAWLAVPDLRIRQGRGGALALTGRIEASGALPGGYAEALKLPLDGTISPAGAVSLWAGCTDLAFRRLRVSNLSLDGQSLTLCPPSGSSILAYDAGGLRLAAGAPSLQLRGTLGQTPVHLSSGPVGLAWPGALSARAIAVELGEPANATRFTITDLSARLGEEIGGTFVGTDVLLAAVPLDIREAGGMWGYAEGVLSLSGVSFRMEDRQEAERFHPLVAHGAGLTLADNVIRTAFALQHPASGTRVADVSVVHDLADATGHADLAVPGVTFGPGFQPRDISELAYGVVSLVEGTVTGEGRVDWNSVAVTSSGRFSSDGIDLAAAFGPVKGARGTVVFTDLIGLTTAPDQRIAIDAVNPGIEVNDGVVLFSLTDGTRLELASAEWPFLGGRLSMQPLVMNIGSPEVRRYVFQIEGLEAARLIERMELNNLAATGSFDGLLPVEFDAMGNGRLEGGMLSARSPGGHVSYIGQLTYEDLSFVGNFAFQGLRDLNYDRMEVLLDGPLTGELVTRVRLDGVRQGATAQTNFITRRIAELPIRLVVNLRAPFYQMISSMRSLYDPASVRDPRGLGLLTDDGRSLRTVVNGADLSGEAEPAGNVGQNDEPPIQPSEREAMP